MQLDEERGEGGEGGDEEVPGNPDPSNPDKSLWVNSIFEALGHDSKVVRILKLTNQAVLSGGMFLLRTHGAISSLN